MKLVFFGAGYCSDYILPRIGNKFEIICTHNKDIKQKIFDKNLNIKRITFSEFLKNKKYYLKETSHILNSIPPFEGKDLVYTLFKDLNESFLSSIKWYGYLSSTSVYGDHSGNWVNEKTKTTPQTKRGVIRKEIEQSFLTLFHKNKLPVHIFRLPGIYGPGRSALDKLIRGRKIIVVKPNQFFSRVFVEDIAKAIILSMREPTPGEIFNITDNFPCSSQEVTEFAAKLLKMDNLQYINVNSTEIDQVTKEFYKDNKKVSNEKIKKILGWTPKFENYKLGLVEIYKTING